MTLSPIFVHSLFRSGSTYIFNVFRRSTGGYWCYQEPCHEHLRHLADAPERLLDISSEHGSLFRHPILDKPYFWEFYQVKDAIAQLFKKEFSYDWFFIGESNPSFKELASYLQCLIDGAKGRPLLQCCRTFGHVAALQNVFAGTHINLWRNPRDQWWSYKVGVSFDATVLLILNALELPRVLASVKAICGVPDIHDRNIEQEFAIAQRRCLASRESYLAFYALWVYSMLEVPKVANLSINIDSLSSSNSYRSSTLAKLAVIGVTGLDFSDCAIVQAKFGVSDIAFFEEIERRVHDIYLEYGYASEELAALLALRARHRPRSRRLLFDFAADAARIREVALRKIDSLAETSGELLETRGQLADADRDLANTVALVTAQHEEIATTKATLVARDQDLARAHANSNALVTELADARFRLTTAGEDLAAARARLDSQEFQLASSHHRSQRLFDELTAVGSRLEQASREKDRWWTVADDTSKHLAAIYASRSWRLTAPLREVNAWRKRALGESEIGVAALTSLPRRAVRRVLLAAWAHAQGRPERRARFVRLLAPFPRLYARLRIFAFAQATAAPRSMTRVGPPPLSGAAASEDGIRWNDLPASVQQVHQQLMGARNAASGSANQRSRTQTLN